MISIHLIGSGGVKLGELPARPNEIIAQAEQHARDQNMSKRRCFPILLKQHVTAAGYQISDADLADGVAQLEAFREGNRSATIQLRATRDSTSSRTDSHSTLSEHRMSSKSASTIASRFFETERAYPNPEARAWYDRLVGIDEHKQRLLLELELLLFPDRIAEWSRNHHGQEIRACQIMASRAPLILLEGDVGCGKTVLAETIGDPLAERAGGKVHLLKINTQVRGTGLVGEMTELIVQAFAQAEARADSLRGAPLLLLIDEADALAGKRMDQHMHHEDKAGLNTLLQRIDGLRMSGRRIAVIFITNRPDALDPAIRRRSALQLTFLRPNDEARAELFRHSVPEIEFSTRQLQDLVASTGTQAQKKYKATFTSSDITDRLIPAALRDSYAARQPLTAAGIIRHAQEMQPTPLMNEVN